MKQHTPAIDQDNMRSWLQYFHNTWMQNTEIWNVSNTAIRNNDLAENQNFVLSRLLGKHPSLFDFIFGYNRSVDTSTIKKTQ